MEDSAISFIQLIVGKCRYMLLINHIQKKKIQKKYRKTSEKLNKISKQQKIRQMYTMGNNIYVLYLIILLLKSSDASIIDVPSTDYITINENNPQSEVQTNQIYDLTYYNAQKINHNIIIEEIQTYYIDNKLSQNDNKFLGFSQDSFSDVQFLSDVQINYNMQLLDNQDKYQINRNLQLPESNNNKNTKILTQQQPPQFTYTQPAPTITLSGNSDNQPSVQILTLSPQSQLSTITDKKIINTQFTNIGLYHNLPVEYIEGQVFLFYGVVTNVQEFMLKKLNRVSVIFWQKNSQYQIKCTEQHPRSIQFNISCKLDKPGVYFLYIFAGNSAKGSKILRTIKKNQDLFKSNYIQPLQPKPQGLKLDIINNNLYVCWESKANITNLTIYQTYNGSINKKQYLLSNNHEKFKVPYLDFQNFIPKVNTYVEISHAMSSSGTLPLISSKFSSSKSMINFEPIDHAFDILNETSISIINTQFPWRCSANEKIKLNIAIKEPIQSLVYIVEPDLKLRKLLFLTQSTFNFKSNQNYIIRPPTQLILQISFSMTGTHIIEINNVGGMAVFNRPIYVGQGYPLIPDYRDMVPISFVANRKKNFQAIYERYYQRTTQKLISRQPSKDSPLQQKRTYILNLLNGLRKKYNLFPLYLDNQLNKIAKNHTDDMIQRQYVGHINPEGQKPLDRARKLNFTGPIGENLAKANYLTQIHLELQRSPKHLQNIINRDWNRVGISANLTKKKSYIVTYEFSSRDYYKKILQKQQISYIKVQLLYALKQINPTIQKQNEIISEDIIAWMDSDRNLKLLQFIIKKRGYKDMKGIALKVYFNGNWIKGIKNFNILNGFTKYKQVSIGIENKKSQIGYNQIYVIFI